MCPRTLLRKHWPLPRVRNLTANNAKQEKAAACEFRETGSNGLGDHELRKKVPAMVPRHGLQTLLYLISYIALEESKLDFK